MPRRHFTGAILETSKADQPKSVVNFFPPAQWKSDRHSLSPVRPPSAYGLLDYTRAASSTYFNSRVIPKTKIGCRRHHLQPWKQLVHMTYRRSVLIRNFFPQGREIIPKYVSWELQSLT